MTEKAESIVRVLGVIGDTDPDFLHLVDKLFEYVRHDGDCEYLEPMWHQGPCDCGLHDLTKQFPQWLQNRLLLATTTGNRKAFGRADPHGLFPRATVNRDPKLLGPRGQSYHCNVPMCGESGVCQECRARGTR